MGFFRKILIAVDDSAPAQYAADPFERAMHEAATRGVPAEGIVLERAGRVSGTIVRNAVAQGCDAIVMATHAREGIPHLTEGSVTEAVVRTSDIPVIAVRGG